VRSGIKGGEEVPRVGSEYGAIRQEVPVPCVEISEVTVKSGEKRISSFVGRPGVLGNCLVGLL